MRLTLALLMKYLFFCILVSPIKNKKFNKPHKTQQKINILQYTDQYWSNNDSCSKANFHFTVNSLSLSYIKVV